MNLLKISKVKLGQSDIKFYLFSSKALLGTAVLFRLKTAGLHIVDMNVPVLLTRRKERRKVLPVYTLLQIILNKVILFVLNVLYTISKENVKLVTTVTLMVASVSI